MKSKDKLIEEMEKKLAWFNDFADCVQGNHRVYDIACEYAEEMEAERNEESEESNI